MTDRIRIKNQKSTFQITKGERTLDLMSRLSKLSDEEKETLLNESAEILSHCVNPIDTYGQVTGLAFGYVQSGKTMSFTTLSTLAVDNGFRIIIYLAGTKNNLLEQTTDRLKNDLLTDGKNRRVYKVYKNLNENNTIAKALKLKSKPAILITILKSKTHIDRLAKIFSSRETKSILRNSGVLIIDDEADQASLNTYARANSKSEDWEEDEFSSTYSSILRLKESIPNHSYIQYTATPQGPLLINLMDLLSPEFHVVLTPGKDYTGGEVFFKEKKEIIITIPQDEVYHHSNNPLDQCPISLINALQVYLIGVAIQVNIFKKEDFLSMMVHADRETDASKKFHSWIESIITNWEARLNLPEKDPSKIELLKSFENNYREAIRIIDNPPSFEEVMDQVIDVILDTNVELVIQGFSSVDWSNNSSHILVGAEMLNRGFTVEGLIVTYMPRTTVSRSNADTIQQRCRFFGYKRSYLESCRVYLPNDSILEYMEYIEHEELIRSNLKSSTLRQLVEQVLILGDKLNPTRNNILSGNIIHDKLIGWRQLNAIGNIDDNTKYIERFIRENQFQKYKEYGTDNRNHMFIKLNINLVIQFLVGFRVNRLPDALRKSSTIQYLRFLSDKGIANHAYIYHMAHNVTEGKQRELKADRDSYRINNIFTGRSNDGGKKYPGDRAIYFKDSFCIQIHKIKLKHNTLKWDKKQLYTLGIYYPEAYSHRLIAVSK